MSPCGLGSCGCFAWLQDKQEAPTKNDTFTPADLEQLKEWDDKMWVAGEDWWID